MEPVTIAAGALITQVVKSGYEKWIEGQTESLALTDEAKAVLTRMQSDPTNNGEFLNATGLSETICRVVCRNATSIEIETTRRVIIELEAKGLIINALSGTDGKVTLKHLGWILNPETGKVNKVG